MIQNIKVALEQDGSGSKVSFFFFLHIYIFGFPLQKKSLINFIYNMCLIRHLQNRFSKFLYGPELSKYQMIHLFIFKLLMFSFRMTTVMRLARTHTQTPYPFCCTIKSNVSH